MPNGVKKLQRVGRLGTAVQMNSPASRVWPEAAAGAGRGGPRTRMDSELPVEAPSRWPGCAHKEAKSRRGCDSVPLTADKGLTGSRTYVRGTRTWADARAGQESNKADDTDKARLR